MDKLHFHEIFTGICIKENESAKSFLKCFTYGKTTAEATSNTYTEEQLVDFVLAGLRHTRKDVYQMAMRLYQLECHQGKLFMYNEIEQNLFEMDKEFGREKSSIRAK
jgi:hypothetical protein